MVDSHFLKNRQLEVCHVVPGFLSLISLDRVDKMDTSSLEGPWKSLLATGPKHPHPYLYQSGHLPPGASNHIWDQRDLENLVGLPVCQAS